MEYFSERSDQFLKQGRYSELKKLCEEELKQNPESIRALTFLGYSKIMLNDASGLEQVENSIKLNPTNHVNIYMYSVCLSNTGHRTKAITEIKRAIEMDPTCAGYHAFLARLYVDDKLFKLALAKCDFAIKLDPTHLKAWSIKAYCFLMLEDLKSAKLTIKESLKIDPEDSYTNEVAGLIYSKGNNFSRAKEFITNSLKKEPENKAVQKKYFEYHSNKWIDLFVGDRTYNIVYKAILMLGGFWFLAYVFERLDGNNDFVNWLIVIRVVYYGFIYISVVEMKTIFLVLFAPRKIRNSLVLNSKMGIIYTVILIFLSVLVYDIFSLSILSFNVIIFCYHSVQMLLLMFFFKKINEGWFIFAFFINLICLIMFFIATTEVFFTTWVILIFITTIFISRLYRTLFRMVANNALNLS